MNLKIISNFKKLFLILLTILFLFNLNIEVAAVDYRAKIAETEKRAQEFAAQLAQNRNGIEDARRKAGSLADEIAALNAESKKFSDMAIQARALAVEYEAEKLQFEIEIAKLKVDSKNIYKEIQKQYLISPIQNIFASRNFGEVISNIYKNSTLEQKAERIQLDIKEKIALKEQAIENQKKVADEATKADQQAQYKKAEVQVVLEQTKGEEAKYQQLAAQANAEIDAANAQKAKFAAQEAAEQERIRQELEAQRQAELARRLAAQTPVNSGTNNGNTTGQIASTYQTKNVAFDSIESLDYSGKCRFEAKGVLSVSTGYFAQPTTGRFEREFGLCNHDGIDISNSTGTPIYAADAGTVVRAQTSFDGYGMNIVLAHRLPNGDPVYTLYGHLSGFKVAAGESVSRGQLIGVMGSTGNSTGPHLHFMIIDGAGYDGPSCKYANSKCYRPRDYINF
jgi:murein DD-endopeptidase MepM/ murein hydrolase activator NlpD